MNTIILKGNTHWCSHSLVELTPIDENHNPCERVFKIDTDYFYNILRDENRIDYGIEFHGGPVLYIGETYKSIDGLTLREICPYYDSEHNYLGIALVFT